MIIKINWKKLILCLAIPLFFGILAAIITKGDMNVYETLNQPPLSPPAIVFPIVWSILYILMGISLYLIVMSDKRGDERSCVLLAFALQLFLNFIWSPIFFSAREFFVALIVLILLLAAVIIQTALMSKINKKAAYLQIPYIIWLCIALYLNIGILALN